MDDELPLIRIRPGGKPPAEGDELSARQWLQQSVGDDESLAQLRLTALAVADGTPWSRLNDHELIDQLASRVAGGWVRTAPTTALPLLRLVPATTPAPAAAATPAPAPRAAPAAAPPPSAESTFEVELDVAAMVAVLVQAAQDGVPFCEECARAAAAAG